MVVTTRPPTEPGHTRYATNRPPLLPEALIKLPAGSIAPQGWLRTQLELLADGFVGHLPELSAWCCFEGNAWAAANGEGHSPWEELPYWLRGLVALGHSLGDARIVGEAGRWIEAVLAGQRPDGYLGPERNRHSMDLWPNMVMLYALRTHYEATNDARVLQVMARYFRWQMQIPLHQFLPATHQDDWQLWPWQKWRGADNLDSIYWLYRHTGEGWLLDLARVTYERTADWAGDIPTWHGVNICQGFRAPAQYFQQTGDARYYRAAERALHTVMAEYGQVPGGMFGADENCRRGFTGARQGAETCSMVELMHSYEILLRIGGDVRWADACEDVAFNALPAALTPDLRGLHYLTAPNMVRLDRANKAPLLENSGDMLSYDPHRYRCCQHNVGFGWPYFVEHMWLGTHGNGLAAVLYGPSVVQARVGAGSLVRIRMQTEYPFDETIVLRIEQLGGGEAVRFPLLLRVPGWCEVPQVAVNNEPVALPLPATGWVVLDREWRAGDEVQLVLPAEVRAQVWENNAHAVSVRRGPLTYALRIGERWQAYGDDARWPAYEVLPTTPWNYGLALPAHAPEQAIAFERRPGPLPQQPFVADAAPLVLRAPGRRIDQWQAEANGLVGALQPGPIRSDEPLEALELIPMGCARLRISAFPQVVNDARGKPWPTITASHLGGDGTVAALNDSIEPTSSADQLPCFTWGERRGTNQWLQYDWGEAREVSWCAIYWYDDEALGGELRVPARWRLRWWDGRRWQSVVTTDTYGVVCNGYNRVAFAPVSTTALRLDVKLRPRHGAGLLAWRWGIGETGDPTLQ
jgi:hypothetical protein